jgi:Ras GTPase-activating-like protein IQGAP2/3
MEINPIKVYEGYIIDYETTTGKPFELNRKPTPEEAAANPQVQAIIGPRLRALEEMSTTFLNAILNSTDLVPYGIRWICKQIRELTKSKFPTSTRAQTCSLIGGFFLLRFINPAIVTPQAFMLVDAKLSVNTRRNLTLLAKILQNLANNVQFGGVKEFFMEPLNPFLERSRDRLNDFLETLTRVDNLSEHLMLDKYLALGKTTDTSINISLNEMYFVHALLQAHLEVLAPEKDSPLRQILQELGPAPPQLPRGENATVDLKLANRFENEPGNALNMRPERMYNETKYLLFYILKTLPTITNDDNGDIKKQIEMIANYAQERKDQDLLEKTKKIIHNCKKLVQDGLLSEDDNYAMLRKDIIQELLNYETYIQKSSTDLDRLKQVRQAIQEHNGFLQQQLSTYEVYLVNVKQQSLPHTPSGPTHAAGVSANNATGDKKTKEKVDKDKDKKQSKKKQSFKFSHVQLEKDGIIISSDVPDERRSNIFFSFASPTPGTYTVTVLYKSRVISEMSLQLDELLERQANNSFELETDFLKLNVNLLVYLLNKTFIA